jgi:hypothetical protein
MNIPKFQDLLKGNNFTIMSVSSAGDSKFKIDRKTYVTKDFHLFLFGDIYGYQPAALHAGKKQMQLVARNDHGVSFGDVTPSSVEPYLEFATSTIP